MKKVLFLSISFLLSVNVNAKDYLKYVDNPDGETLRQFITSGYTKLVQDSRCDPRYPFCDGGNPVVKIIPPATPEMWYFVSDKASVMQKYKAWSNAGSLAIAKQTLNADEQLASDYIKQARIEVYDTLRDFDANMNAQNNAGTVTEARPLYKLKNQIDCKNGRNSEDMDSVFDLLKSDINAIHENWIQNDILPVFTEWESKLANIGAQVGYPWAFSINARSTFSIDQFSTWQMPDGGVAHYNFDHQGLPYLNLDRSFTPPRGALGNRQPLSDFFHRRGHEQSQNYQFIAQGFNGESDSCLIEEITTVSALVGDHVARDFSGLAADEVGKFGMCWNVQRGNSVYRFTHIVQDMVRSGDTYTIIARVVTQTYSVERYHQICR